MKTAGYEAEYGQSTGGVVNVITKSGTNDCAAALFGYFRPTALESEFEQVQTANGTDQHGRDATSDVGFDRRRTDHPRPLFFFGASTPVGDAHVHAPAGFPLESLRRGRSRSASINSYSGKAELVRSATATGSTRRSSAIRRRATRVRSAASLAGTDTAALQRARVRRPQSDRRSTTASPPSWLIEATVRARQNNIVETPSVNVSA